MQKAKGQEHHGACPAGNPVIERRGVLFVLWLVCFWLYRQETFLKL